MVTTGRGEDSSSISDEEHPFGEVPGCSLIW